MVADELTDPAPACDLDAARSMALEPSGPASG
jgi:hypothetical protein